MFSFESLGKLLSQLVCRTVIKQNCDWSLGRLVVNQNEKVNSLSVPNHYHFFEDMTIQVIKGTNQRVKRRWNIKYVTVFVLILFKSSQLHWLEFLKRVLAPWVYRMGCLTFTIVCQFHVQNLWACSSWSEVAACLQRHEVPPNIHFQDTSFFFFGGAVEASIYACTWCGVFRNWIRTSIWPLRGSKCRWRFVNSNQIRCEGRGGQAIYP